LFDFSIAATMTSRFMLNLHETANIGIWSTVQYTMDYKGPDGGVEATQENVVELDTILTENTGCEPHELRSVPASGLERIDEEQAGYRI
jgi:hypothetical protein